MSSGFSDTRFFLPFPLRPVEIERKVEVEVADLHTTGLQLLLGRSFVSRS